MKLEIKIEKIGEKLKEGERESGKRKRVGWWDEECEGKRREVRRTLRVWRKSRGEGRVKGIGRREQNTSCYVKGKEVRKTRDGLRRRRKQGRKGRYGGG